jgi:hypothetical protein
MNHWMKEIGMRCLDLFRTISPNYEETRRVKLSLEGLQYDADDHTVVSVFLGSSLAHFDFRRLISSKFIWQKEKWFGF